MKTGAAWEQRTKGTVLIQDSVDTGSWSNNNETVVEQDSGQPVQWSNGAVSFIQTVIKRGIDLILTGSIGNEVQSKPRDSGQMAINGDWSNGPVLKQDRDQA